MINVERLFKAGRETKIFEVSDRLQVNDFYNVTGYQHSSQEGKMSRVKLTIVDVTKGKKSAANVGEFNLKTSEWMKYIPAMRTPKEFISLHRDKFIRISKANPYKKIGDLIEVKHLNISYEDKLRTPKWKFEITTGTAIPKKDGFGYEVKSFKEIGTVNFLLDIAEVLEMVCYVTEYISNWKKSTFTQYLKCRQAFIQRLVENNYNEETIDIWNNNPCSKKDIHYKKHNSPQSPVNNSNTTKNSSSKSVATSNASKQTSVGNPQLDVMCSACGKNITAIEAEKSKALFGKVLCKECLVK